MKIKKIIATVLSLALLLNAKPIYATEYDSTTDSEESQIETLQKLLQNRKTNVDTNDNDYVKGEAIVVVAKRSTINTLSKSKTYTERINQDIQVVNSYDFTENTISKKAVKSFSSNSQGFYAQLVKSDTLTTSEIIKAMEQNSSVLYAEPNYKVHIENVTDDSYENLQWAIENNKQNSGTANLDTNVENQWALNEKASNVKENVIAIVDTGVDYDHEDLENVMWDNPYSCSQLDGWCGYNFFDNDSDPYDDHGHGTHCAGIIAGESNNGTGITGISNTNTKIMALKFLDKNGDGDIFKAIGCYQYILKAKELGTNVVAVNNSWGETFGSDLLEDVMNMADSQGIISVIAAGNSSDDLNRTFDYPAFSSLEHSVVVGASNEKDEMADFTCYGSETVDLAAPGTDILSSVSYNCLNPTIYNQAKKDKILSAYHDGETYSGFGEITVNNASGASVTAQVMKNTTQQYFGVSGSALGFEFNQAQPGETYTIKIPYNINESTTNIYNSFMLKNGDKEDYNTVFNGSLLEINNVVYENVEYNGVKKKKENSRDQLLSTYLSATNHWSHYHSKVLDSSSTSGFMSGCLELTVTIKKSGNYCFYLDDLGVSKENISSNQFEQYDFFNGTSMAAPQVVGAIALIAQTTTNPDEILSRLYACTRKSDSWKNKSRTGAVLDFSKLTDNSPVIRTTLSDGNNLLTLNGYNFGNNIGSITISGASIAATDICSWSDQQIQLKASDYLYKSVEIAVTTQTGKQCSSTYLLKNTTTKMDYIGKVHASSNNENTASLDNNVKTQQTIYSTDGENIYSFDGRTLSEISKTDGEQTTLLSITKNDYRDYLDAYQSVTSVIYGTDQLIYGNGSLWFLTSINDGYKFKYFLHEYNIAKKVSTFSEIPDGMMLTLEGTICFYNNRIYSLGGLDANTGMSDQVVYYDLAKKTWNKDVSLPFKGLFGRAISFNGKMYYVGALNDTINLENLYSFDGSQWTKENAEFKYLNYIWKKKSILGYNSIGLAKDQLIFMSNGDEELGEIMAYDLKQQKLVSTGYSYDGDGLSKGTLGMVTIYDQLYMFADDNGSVDNIDNNTKIYRMNVTPYETKKEPVVTPTPTPVSTPTPTKKPATVVKKKVTKITIKASSRTLKVGKKLKLKAVITPSNAYNKKVTWSINQKKYAKITASGVLTAKKAGAGKKIIVTAKAKDGSKVKKTIIIRIKK